MPNIIIGLLALAFGLWGLSVWWWSVTELLRGLVPLLLLGVGFVALAAGISNVQITTVKNKEHDEDNEQDDFSSELDSQELKTESKDQQKTKAKPKTVSKAVFKAEKSTKQEVKPAVISDKKPDLKTGTK